MSDPTRKLLTIGHSNHPPNRFLDLVAANRIEIIVDVRSWPHSRYAMWADRVHLPALLRTVGCQHIHLGAELGGRPHEEHFYDETGHVLYARLSRTSSYRRGVDKLKRSLLAHRVAVMCSEENPRDCHRRLLIAKTLLDEGVSITHVRGNGCLEPEVGIEPPDGGRLFDDEDRWWKSSASVSHRRRQRTSSIA
jgi:uncharacterized protein (DUF488 family)